MLLEIYNAAKEGNLVDVKSLIEQGADVDATDNEGKSALYYASGCGHFEIVKLLEKKANINIATANGYTPLHLAIMREHYEIAELLIKNGADVHAKTENGNRPLHFAATSESGSSAGIKLLIENKAVVDVADGESPETPLFRACIEGFFDRAELLIKHGADVNKVALYETSPLHWACERGHTKVSELLIKHGADINKIDVDGETPLFKAFNHIPTTDNHISTTKFLIDIMLERNRLQEKPNYIKEHEYFSDYWDKQMQTIDLKIDYLLKSEMIGCKNSTQVLLNKIPLVTNNSLLLLSFRQFFKLLNPEAIEKTVSNKTDNSEENISSPPGLGK